MTLVGRGEGKMEMRCASLQLGNRRGNISYERRLGVYTTETIYFQKMLYSIYAPKLRRNEGCRGVLLN